MDQRPAVVMNGFHTPNIFNQTMFNADTLPFGQHTLTITNQPTSSGPFMDIDYIDIGRQIGQPE